MRSCPNSAVILFIRVPMSVGLAGVLAGVFLTPLLKCISKVQALTSIKMVRGLVCWKGVAPAQRISMEETLQKNAAAIEMEKAVGKLLEDSFNLIEQEPVEA